MTSEPALELGPDKVVGSYRLVREIGRGGMGTVFEARHTVLPRRAALKVMHAELRKHPGMATRVVQEASILEHVRHPGVVRVFDCNLLARSSAVDRDGARRGRDARKPRSHEDTSACRQPRSRRCSRRSPTCSRRSTRAVSCTAISSPTI